MQKQKKSSRDGLFLILGIFGYSFFFWITNNNTAHVFGLILIGLACSILYKMEHKVQSKKDWMTTRDIIYTCIGTILGSFMEGFPFSYLAF